MRYFALGTLLNYGETSMFNGRGDDYALYRGIKDPRFVPIGHDFDTVFGQGDAVDNPPGQGYYPLRTNASIYIMLNPGNKQFGDVFDTYVYVAGIQQGQFSYSTAVGLFKSTVGLILVLGANYFSRKVGEEGLF